MVPGKNAKKRSKTWGKKKSKNYSTPLVKFCKGCRHVSEPTITKRVFQTTTTGLAFFGALSLSLCKILNYVKSVCSQSLLMEVFTVFFFLRVSGILIPIYHCSYLEGNLHKKPLVLTVKPRRQYDTIRHIYIIILYIYHIYIIISYLYYNIIIWYVYTYTTYIYTLIYIYIDIYTS